MLVTELLGQSRQEPAENCTMLVIFALHKRSRKHTRLKQRHEDKVHVVFFTPWF
jgi:hypothetical protein